MVRWQAFPVRTAAPELRSDSFATNRFFSRAKRAGLQPDRTVVSNELKRVERWNMRPATSSKDKRRLQLRPAAGTAVSSPIGSNKSTQSIA